MNCPSSNQFEDATRTAVSLHIPVTDYSAYRGNFQLDPNGHELPLSFTVNERQTRAQSAIVL